MIPDADRLCLHGRGRRAQPGRWRGLACRPCSQHRGADAAGAEHRVGAAAFDPRAFAASTQLAPAPCSSLHQSDCSTRFSRNSRSGGSSRRTVTGRPFMAVKMPSKPWSAASAGSRRAPRSCPVLGQDHLPDGRAGPGPRTCARSGTARCPRRRVRGPLEASSKLSALARTPRRRTPSAHSTSRVKSSLICGGMRSSASP